MIHFRLPHLKNGEQKQSHSEVWSLRHPGGERLEHDVALSHNEAADENLALAFETALPTTAMSRLCEPGASGPVHRRSADIAPCRRASAASAATSSTSRRQCHRTLSCYDTVTCRR